MTTDGATGETWTVQRILAWTTSYLREHGSESPRLEAEILLAHARKCSRIQLYTQFDAPLTEEQRSIMRDLVKRRAAAEPVAYLVGHREFFSLDFFVTRNVLIPRPDTETLVMAALDLAKPLTHPEILDLCTGSGCVAIALAVNLPPAVVTATELQPATAQVTRQNIERHQVSDRVKLLIGDLFEPLAPQSRFDLIVSNPPYIPSEEIANLATDVRDHEPRIALDGGPDGLDIVRRLIEQAPQHLKSPGWLLLEIDPAQAAEVESLLLAQGFTHTQQHLDLAKEPRVVQGLWEG